MIRRWSVLGVLAAGVGLASAMAVGTAGAQSFGPLSAAKRSASRAAAATNAHVRAEQDVDADARTASGKGAKPAPAAARATRTTTPPSPRGAAASGGRTAAPADSQTPRRGTGRGGRSGAGAEPGGAQELTLLRESFTYEADGRRDPFVSLLKSGELRPMLSDLRLVTIIYDPAGRSVAVLRDLSTKEQYRVRVGQTLGRMRVTRIRPKSVTFTLDEYGFSRQEVLALNDTTRARSQ